MLPLFIGLAAISGVLSLGLAEVCSSYIYRESMQDTADQVALISAEKGLTTADQALQQLAKLSNRYQIADYQLGDGRTAELKICGNWQGWLRLPGLGRQIPVCVTSAAR